MKLPNHGRAFVDPVKVRDYLLASGHPTGRGKARFFEQLGFTRDDWTRLHRILLEIGRSGDASAVGVTPYGQKYVVRAMIRGPHGGAALVTVWIVLLHEGFPRLVTAYPGDVR